MLGLHLATLFLFLQLDAGGAVNHPLCASLQYPRLISSPRSFGNVHLLLSPQDGMVTLEELARGSPFLAMVLLEELEGADAPQVIIKA